VSSLRAPVAKQLRRRPPRKPNPTRLPFQRTLRPSFRRHRPNRTRRRLRPPARPPRPPPPRKHDRSCAPHLPRSPPAQARRRPATMVFRAAGFLTAAALVTGAAWAAEPSAVDRESARAYMAEGRQKRDAGDLKAALRAFQAADAVMHVPTTGFEVAKTEAL